MNSDSMHLQTQPFADSIEAVTPGSGGLTSNDWLLGWLCPRNNLD